MGSRLVGSMRTAYSEIQRDGPHRLRATICRAISISSGTSESARLVAIAHERERSLRKETDTESENRHAFQSKEGTTFSVLHDATDDRNMPTSLRLNGTLNLAKRNTYRVHPVLTCDFQSGAPTLDVSSTVLPSPQDPTHVPYASSASCTDQSVIPKTAYSSAAEHPALLPKLSTRMGLSILSAQSVPPGPQHSPLAKATGLKPNARDAVLTHTLDYEANEARTSTAFTTAQMPATPNHSAYRENEDHTPRRRLVDYESSTTVSSSPQHPNSAAVLGLIPKHPIPSTPGVSAIIGSDSPVNNRKGRQRHGLSERM